MQRALRIAVSTVAVLGIAACDTARQNAVPAATIAENTPYFKSSRNAFEQQILAQPQLAAARKTTQARALAIVELDAARAVQLGVSGNAGFTDDSDPSGPAPLVSVSATATKLLSDGGRLDAQKQVAEIAIAQARLEYALQGNQFIGQVLDALVTRNTARATIAVIDKNLAAYAQRAPQINAAATQGVLTNSDLIEIRSVKSKIESQRLEARLAQRTAQSQLAQLLTPAARKTLQTRFSRATGRNPKGAPNFQAEALRLGGVSLAAQAEAAALRTTSDVSAITRLTMPATDSANAGVFVGLSWSWSVLDGGASDATARRLQLERESADLARKDVIQGGDLAAQGLAIAQATAGERRALLRDRIALSKSRLQELETLLRAGRADVASIARELLAGAEAEVQLATLSAEVAQQQIDAFSARGATCALVDMCHLFMPATRK